MADPTTLEELVNEGQTAQATDMVWVRNEAAMPNSTHWQVPRDIAFAGSMDGSFYALSAEEVAAGDHEGN